MSCICKRKYPKMIESLYNFGQKTYNILPFLHKYTRKTPEFPPGLKLCTAPTAAAYARRHDHLRPCPTSAVERFCQCCPTERQPTFPFDHELCRHLPLVQRWMGTRHDNVTISTVFRPGPETIGLPMQSRLLFYRTALLRQP